MQPSAHKVSLHGGLPQRAQGFQSVHEDESAQNQALGASGQPILALGAQNRPLSAQSKPDCTEIGAAKMVDQTFLNSNESGEPWNVANRSGR